MSQKTEKEETDNMCQNCFSATTTTTSSAAISPPSTSLTGNITSSRSLKRSYATHQPELSSDKTMPFEAKRVVNRCSGCRRRIGLTGFRCRCGEVFCYEHRYSDRHDCCYDYKAAGKEAIARENPLIRAAKIVKV